MRQMRDTVRGGREASEARWGRYGRYNARASSPYAAGGRPLDSSPGDNPLPRTTALHLRDIRAGRDEAGA